MSFSVQFSENVQICSYKVRIGMMIFKLRYPQVFIMISVSSLDSICLWLPGTFDSPLAIITTVSHISIVKLLLWAILFLLFATLTGTFLFSSHRQKTSLLERHKFHSYTLTLNEQK